MLWHSRRTLLDFGAHLFLKVVAVHAYNYGKSENGLGETRPPTPEMVKAATEEDCKSMPLSVKDATVVIPCLARSPTDVAELVRAANSLKQCAVVVVDDGSPDPIPAALFADNVTVVRINVNRGPAAARNVGINHAVAQGARLVCLMDADCEATSNWVESMVRTQSSVQGVVCGITLAGSNSVISRYHDLEGTLNGRVDKDGLLIYGCTCNMSIFTPAFRMHNNLFDESFPHAAYEDIDFCLRACAAGITVRLAPDAIVRHSYDQSLRSFVRQFRRYGRDEWRVTTRHPLFFSTLSGSTMPKY